MTASNTDAASAILGRSLIRTLSVLGDSCGTIGDAEPAYATAGRLRSGELTAISTYRATLGGGGISAT